jgi:predicted transcriptional regulator of viral defense system
MPYNGIYQIFNVAEMSKIAGIGKSSRIKLSKVLERYPRLISAASVAEVLGVAPSEANRVLARWSQSGWVNRVKRGLYSPVSLDTGASTLALEEPFLVADTIYGPGYVGGFSAVKHWDLSEQIIETVYYFTTRQVMDRNPIHGSVQFKLKTVKAAKMFGLKAIWIGSKKINVSDATKTIVDILNDPKLVGGMSIVYDIFKEYCESEYCDFQKLLDYCHKMENKTIFKRLGFMIDTKMANIPKELNSLEKLISTGYSNFDPLIKKNHIIEKWKIKAPVSWVEEYDRKK